MKEDLFDVVLLENDKATVRGHDDPDKNSHVTGVFLTFKEAQTNARKLSRQHGLEYITTTV